MSNVINMEEARKRLRPTPAWDEHEWEWDHVAEDDYDVLFVAEPLSLGQLQLALEALRMVIDTVEKDDSKV